MSPAPAGDAPLVDVLLATYNGARHLAEQLDSLLAQSYPRFRVLVSDDGSRDGTLALLARYQPRFGEGRLRLLDNPAPGHGVARNFEFLMQASVQDGAAACMAFCDQDDVWLPDKLATLVAALARLQRELGGAAQPCLVHCDLAVVDAQLAPLHPSFVRHQRLGAVPCGDTALLSINQVTGCALLASRELLRQALPLPEEALMHDWWCALLAAGGRRRFVDRPLVLYRQHGANQLGAKGRGLGARLARLLREGPAVARRVRALGRATQAQALALRARLVREGRGAGWVDGYLAWRARPLRERLSGFRRYYAGPWLDSLSRLLLW